MTASHRRLDHGLPPATRILPYPRAWPGHQPWHRWRTGLLKSLCAASPPPGAVLAVLASPHAVPLMPTPVRMRGQPFPSPAGSQKDSLPESAARTA